MDSVIQQNQAYYDEQRLEMIEFRVSFGWGQPHGPSPDDSKGYYTTVWARNVTDASNLAFARYGMRWSRIYPPDQWAVWGPSMKGTKELEVLQFYEHILIHPYPERDDRYPKAVYGRQAPSQYKSRT